MTEPVFNPYDVLGVTPDATAEQIKAAYRSASAKAHPDRAGGSTEAMTDVNMAYKVLSDPDLRAGYDRSGATKAPPPLDIRARDYAQLALTNVIRNTHPGQNMIEVTRQVIEQQRSELREKRSVTIEQMEGLKTRMERLKGPPEGFIRGLLDGEHARGEEFLKAFEVDEAIMNRALELLADYTYGDVLLPGSVFWQGFVAAETHL